MGARGQFSRGNRRYTRSRGPVAQLVEQGTFNPKVTGSIPVRPIKLMTVYQSGSASSALSDVTRVARSDSIRNCLVYS